MSDSSSSPKQKKIMKKKPVDSESSSSDSGKKKPTQKIVKKPMTHSASDSDSENKMISLRSTVGKKADVKADAKVQPKVDVKAEAKVPVKAVAKPVVKPQPQEVKKSKLDYSESSDSEKPKKKDGKDGKDLKDSQDLRSSINVVIPYEFSKGDKLVKKNGDYAVKFDDTIILLTSPKNTTIKLFPVREGKQDYVLSKKLIIKGMKGLLTHTIQCSPGNYFNDDKTKTSITIVGLETCHLQSAGNSWIVI